MGSGFLHYDPCRHGTISEFTESHRPSRLISAGGSIQAFWLSVRAPWHQHQSPTQTALDDGRELVDAYVRSGEPAGLVADKLIADLHKLASRER